MGKKKRKKFHIPEPTVFKKHPYTDMHSTLTISTASIEAFTPAEN
jgi:hypothetical protein